MSSSTLVSDAVGDISNSTRRLAFLIPLTLPANTDISSSTSSLNLPALFSNSNSSSSSSSSSERGSRGVLLLVLTVPSSSSGGLGGRDSGFLNFRGNSFNFANFGRQSGFGAGDAADDNEFQDILNRLLQSFQPRGPPPASKKFVDSLPIVQIDARSKEEAIRCPVCLLDFEIDEDVTKLPCSHLFHKECIETWLKQANTCCTCRHQLPAAEEESADEDEEELPPLEEIIEGEAVNVTEEQGDLNGDIFSELPPLVDDLLDLPDFESLFSGSDFQNLFETVPLTRTPLETRSPLDTEVSFQRSVQAPPTPSQARSSSTPAPRLPSATSVASPARPRVLEDDLPPARPNRGRGPAAWLRRKISSMSCFRGLFSS